jgi:hypothetical protein
MKQITIEGIQNPTEEISAKIRNYFKTHGLPEEAPFDNISVPDKSFGFEVFGCIDDIQVSVCYCDYKPRKTVIRDILALDDRISNVEVYRCLSEQNYSDVLSEITLSTPIYVNIAGKLMQTTIYDFVQYEARNRDYSRR